MVKKKLLSKRRMVAWNSRKFFNPMQSSCLAFLNLPQSTSNAIRFYALHYSSTNCLIQPQKFYLSALQFYHITCVSYSLDRLHCLSPLHLHFGSYQLNFRFQPPSTVCNRHKTVSFNPHSYQYSSTASFRLSWSSNSRSPTQHSCFVCCSSHAVSTVNCVYKVVWKFKVTTMHCPEVHARQVHLGMYTLLKFNCLFMTTKASSAFMCAATGQQPVHVSKRNHQCSMFNRLYQAIPNPMLTCHSFTRILCHAKALCCWFRKTWTNDKS